LKNNKILILINSSPSAFRDIANRNTDMAEQIFYCCNFHICPKIFIIFSGCLYTELAWNYWGYF